MKIINTALKVQSWWGFCWWIWDRWIRSIQRSLKVEFLANLISGTISWILRRGKEKLDQLKSPKPSSLKVEVGCCRTSVAEGNLATSHTETHNWIYENNGVMQLAESHSGTTTKRRKALVHLASGQAISSYSCLEQILWGLGWERYYGGSSHPDLLQFHKHSSSSIDLISLPKDFAKFSSIYMYDIVVKNPNIFHVRDIIL